MGVTNDLKSFYKNRRVLVTGSTGFKGTWLCCMLRILGAEVYGYALEPSTSPSLWDIASMDACISNKIADIRDLQELSRFFEEVQPQAVLHLAAQPLVIDGYEEPHYTYETNVMGTVNVLECVRSCEATTSFLNVTTDKVYENLEKPGYGYQEEDKLDGFDPYSNSKSCSEIITHCYSKSFFASDAKGAAAGRCKISTARAGNVIGGGDFSANRIVPDCVRAVENQQPMIIRNPNSVRPYQHVLEPLVAYLRIVAGQEQNDALSGWYNIGPDDKDCVTSGELVNLFAKNWGDGFSVEIGNVDGPHEANFLKLDNAKAKSQLGWHPIWGVEEAIVRTVEWTREWLEAGNVAAATCMDKQINDYLGALS